MPRDIAQRVIGKVDTVKENPKHFLERLSDDPGYKIRAGDYRAIVDVIEEEKMIVVRIVGHRRNIYKKR